MNISNNFFHFLPIELSLKIFVDHCSLQIQHELKAVSKFFHKFMTSHDAWHIRYNRYGFLQTYYKPEIAKPLWHFERKVFWELSNDVQSRDSFKTILCLEPFVLIIQEFTIKILNLSDLWLPSSTIPSALAIQPFTSRWRLQSACTDKEDKQYAVGGCAQILVGSRAAIYPKTLSIAKDCTASHVCFLNPNWLAWAYKGEITIINIETKESLYRFQIAETVRKMDLCGDLLDCLVGPSYRLLPAKYRYSYRIQQHNSEQLTHFRVDNCCCLEFTKTVLLGEMRLFAQSYDIYSEPFPSQNLRPSVFRSYEHSSEIQNILVTKTKNLFVLLGSGCFEYLDRSGTFLAQSTALQLLHKKGTSDFWYQRLVVIGTTLFGLAESLFASSSVPLDAIDSNSERVNCKKARWRFIWNPETGQEYIYELKHIESFFNLHFSFNEEEV